MLQRQAFQINSYWLKLIQEKEEIFVEYGYLMPRFLASLNVKETSDLLRELYMKDEDIKQLCSFNELLQTLCKNIQRARYEQFIIKLADGYQFDLPAFLDFRGRIYRSGVLHFHERDLARSLIVFADCKEKELGSIEEKIYLAATAFHYKTFGTVKESRDWLFNNLHQFLGDNIFQGGQEAKHPFQFISKMISYDKRRGIRASIPITQDASASAYQIMSYFLLDETLAKRTNLIPDGEIQDVYSFLLKELKEFMKAEAELDNNIPTVVCDLLNRKLVKGIFMPIIYGKTLMSTANDLKDLLSQFITYKECFVVASVCFKFWKTK